MRIEKITDENIEGLPDAELRNLRIRFIDIFERYFTDPAVRKAVDIGRQTFYEKYIILRAEMTGRGMKFFWNSLLDKAISSRIFKSSMWDLDVPAMGEVAIVPEYVSVGGSFIKSPKDAKDIDIIIRDSEENRDESFELKVGRLIERQTKKEPHFVYAPKGPHSSYIPLFDLVLRAREETRKVRVKESIVAKELTPAQRKECDEETERIKENREKAEWPHKFKPAKYTHPNGHPRCLICGDEEEVGGICHKDLAKGETKQELNLEDFEYLIHHIEVKDDKELVHHCLLVDHIANTFEQSHLWIDKGKVYLDGKEIKEGYFHIIKGLEPTQEVTWSDEEAIEAGIKPKEIKTGLTKKEKAKIW